MTVLGNNFLSLLLFFFSLYHTTFAMHVLEPIKITQLLSPIHPHLLQHAFQPFDINFPFQHRRRQPA